MKPQLNPWLRFLSWALSPLQNELNASLEEELADAQEKLGEARQDLENALRSVDDANAHNARLHRELEEFREGVPELDEAMAAMERRIRCSCRAGRGEPS